MNRKTHFLYDKLRFAKRKTTKREFNFKPIKLGAPKMGDVRNKDVPETEHTFALSPPKWASSPRETPAAGGSQRNKLIVDISLIEPLPGAKIPEPKQGTDQDDRTINLAALHAAGHDEPKTDPKEKDFPDEDSANRVGKDSETKETDENEPEKSVPSLSKVPSSEKEAYSQVKEAETQPTNVAPPIRKSSSSKSSDKDSEESVRKIWQSIRRRSNSGSSRVSKSQSSRSGSHSSGMGESETDVRKISKINSYKNSREAKQLGGSASEGSSSSSRAKRSKNQNEVETVTQEKVPTARTQSRRLSETRKSGAESANSADREHLPRGKRVGKKSSDSDEDVSRVASALSLQRKRKVSSGSEKLSEEAPSKIRKSSESGKSLDNELADIDKKSDGSGKSTTRSLSAREKHVRVRQSSSSEKSTSGLSMFEKKCVTRSSSSEKSTAEVSSSKRKSIKRSSSSEKYTAEVSTSQRQPVRRSGSSEKSTRRSSSSEKSIAGALRNEKKLVRRSGSSEKSTRRSSSSEKSIAGALRNEKKLVRRYGSSEKSTRRSSSSEKSIAGALRNEKKLVRRSGSSEKSTRRSSSSEKSIAGALRNEKKLVRSGSSEKSTGGVSAAPKIPIRRSSSSEKSTAEVSTDQRKRVTRFSSSEKSTGGVSAAQKIPIRRSSRSEKSTAEVSTDQRKRVTRSSSSEKSIGGVSAAPKIPIRRSSSSEKYTAEVSTVQRKILKKSSSSEKIVETASFKTRKSINREKFAPEEARPSTSREIPGINTESDMSAGEGPSESQMVYSIFQSNSKRSMTSQYCVQEKVSPQLVGGNSSSEEKLSDPQKQVTSKPQITSKKGGAKFKKSVLPQPTKVARQSSGESPSTDEVLFNPQKNKMSTHQILRPEGQLGKPDKIASTKVKKSKLKSSPGKQSKFQGRQASRMSQSQSDSDENFPPAKSKNLSQSQKKSKRRSPKDVSEELSEVISLQDKPVIATFAGLPLLDTEKDTTDKSADDEENVRFEDSMQQFEDILDSNKLKLNRIYDISRELKLSLLQPVTDVSMRSRSVKTVTDLDVLWNFLEKSLSLIIKEAEDEEQQTLVKAMKTYLGKHFSNAINEQQHQIQMLASLKKKSQMIKVLTNQVLCLKQRNRQLARNLYEKEEEKLPQNEDEIMTKFENFCEGFAQFKRN